MARRTKVVVETELKAKDKTSRHLLRVSRTARLARRSVLSLSKGIAVLAVRSARLAAIAAPIGIAYGAIASANRTREMQNMAAAVGQNADAMEAFGLVAGEMGLNFDNIIDMAEEMANKLGESAGLEEIGAVNDALTIMGLNFADIREMAPEEQFLTISDALMAMKDQQQASSAADILFGGEASKFFGYANRMGLSVEDIADKYKRLNHLTDEGRDGSVKLANSFGSLVAQTKTLGAQFTGVMGNALAPFLDKMSAWLTINKELINSTINDWGERFTAWLNGVDWGLVSANITGFGDALKNIPWAEIGSAALTLALNIDKVAAAAAVVVGLYTGSKVLQAIANMKLLMGGSTAAAGTVATAVGTAAAGTSAGVIGGSAVTVAALSLAIGRGLSIDAEMRAKRDLTYQSIGIEEMPATKAEFELNRGVIAERGRDYPFASQMNNSDLTDRLARVFRDEFQKMHGSIDLNVKVNGAPVESVGVSNSASLVGNVGTNLPRSGPR